MGRPSFRGTRCSHAAYSGGKLPPGAAKVKRRGIRVMPLCPGCGREDRPAVVTADGLCRRTDGRSSVRLRPGQAEQMRAWRVALSSRIVTSIPSRGVPPYSVVSSILRCAGIAPPWTDVIGVANLSPLAPRHLSPILPAFGLTLPGR
jgi:hypothetical protein